jgi:hypothetical protein
MSIHYAKILLRSLDLDDPYSTRIKRAYEVVLPRIRYNEQADRIRREIGEYAFSFKLRRKLVYKYSFPIPNKEAVDCLNRYGPIVEMGAARGYWKSLVQCEHTAFDKKVKSTTWAPVQTGEPPILKNFKTSTLFLGWPPLNDMMAHDSLGHWKGSTLIYIGESVNGCTANGQFFRLLERLGFENAETVYIPQWFGIHDNLIVYKR